ncbi:MAG: hypothetical protein M3R30_10285 [Candidatus Eremiobacteraeota bacterium]|nr:hypothetical protein [Candidatus Eremiobacteraeota bacterium]
MKLSNALVRGLAAGAAGSSALNAVGYAEMAVRGRAASETPSKVVQQLAKRTWAAKFGREDASAPTKHRRSALGSLSGLGVGLGVAVVYALLRSKVRIPPLVGAFVLGAAAMASSDLPAKRLGVTDPATWSVLDWISDIVPHAAYGLGAAYTLEMLAPKT